ncbi:MAG TPA: hypothetical protein VH164_15410 [Ktedonobacteraceae bacterium]|jgi:hypothetical protein|nr:hypothetical protein [Ktedonobacteraceae bacterium]
MNEAQLVAATIDVIKREGWTQGALIDKQTKQHCILGAVGKARWGNQWDKDCLSSAKSVYLELMLDRVTGAVINRIAKMLYTNLEPDQLARIGVESEQDLAEDPDGLVIGWNDDLLSHTHGEEELLAVLAKIQAEVG